MKLPQLRGRKWNYSALAFALPFTAIVCLMIIVGCTPFGKLSMLYSDMWHQYFPFFKAFRQALRSGESLLFSWNVGMGMDYLGLISYYLASPLNLVSVILPESWLLPYFSFLVPIKLGLASLFFATFLKKLFHKDDLSIVVFGAFYGLCAWALGYQWNIMWLDTFALLPLVALGTIYLLRDRKFILYTVTLFLSVFANYYVGFFTCIFVFFLFFCYEICYCKSVKRFFLDLARIALFSMLAIGMTAILELPALAALGNTQSSVNSFPDYFSLNMVEYAEYAEAREAWNLYKSAKKAGEATTKLWFTAMRESVDPILEGMKQVAGNLSGGNSPTFKEGLPNVYCGVGTIIFAFLFLTTRHIRVREKLCCAFLLFFFALSFVVRQLDYVWHGFHFPNMIPYRFSFLYSFVMLYMAYRAFLLRRRFRPGQLAAGCILGLWLLLLSQHAAKIPEALESLKTLFDLLGKTLTTVLSGDKDAATAAAKELETHYNTYGDTYIYIVYNAIFLGLYTTLLFLPYMGKSLGLYAKKAEIRAYARERADRRRLSTNLLCLVMAIELVMNVVNFGVNFGYTNTTNYPQGTDATASMITYMKEREKSLFYRAEVTHSQTLNDGALNSYNGISTFTSSANVKVTEFMKALGYGAKNTYNRYCFEESSPVANLFLNLKYMIERQGQVEKNPYFDEVHHYENVYLLENNAYLPLGFLAETDLAQVDFSSAGSPYAFQNTLFSAATGIQDDVWYITPGSWLEIEAKNVDVTSRGTNAGYCAYSTTSKGEIIYRYTAQASGFMCVDLTMNARNSFSVYLNDAYLYSESISLPQTLAVSQVEPGDVVEIRITCKAGENSNITIKGAIVNEEVFRAGYDVLAASTLKLTEFSTTRVEGTISCNRDGLLYTSIPYDGNWTATVDGKDADIILVGDAMVALDLTQGDHEIVFTYHNSAFSMGWKISLGCLAVFIALICWQYQVRIDLSPIMKKFKRKK